MHMSGKPVSDRSLKTHCCKYVELRITRHLRILYLHYSEKSQMILQ